MKYINTLGDIPLVRDEGAAGSNPATPTNFPRSRIHHGERYGEILSGRDVSRSGHHSHFVVADEGIARVVGVNPRWSVRTVRGQEWRRFECGSSCSSTRLAGTPRHTTRCQDVPLVGDSALDSDVTQVAVLIIRPEQHHPVEIVSLVIPVEKRAYLQPRDAPQSRILGPRRGIPD